MTDPSPMTSTPAGPATAPRPAISIRRKLAYVGITFLLVVVGMTAALLVLDVYLHHKVQDVAGVNVWGYRGAPVGRKRPSETRIVAIGGSTVFGFGLPAKEAWPAYLDEALKSRLGPDRVSVVNLGIPTDSARTFVATLDDYAYLRPDVVILYEGYNDMGLDLAQGHNRTNPAVPHYLAWRHQSPVFRWTGYFPIFPLVLSEKAMSMLHGNNLNAAYDNDIVFRPGLATRTTAGAMKAAADLGVAIERRFGKLTNTTAVLSTATDRDCGRWAEYCGAEEAAVTKVLASGGVAVVVTQPYISDTHVEQQAALAGMLKRRFGQDRRVRYVNLGRLLDLHDPQVAYDGMHLVGSANAKVAEALSRTMLELVNR